MKKVKQFENWLNSEIDYCQKNVKLAALQNDYMLPKFQHDLVEATYIKDKFTDIFKNGTDFDELINELQNEIILLKTLRDENEKASKDENRLEKWKMFHAGKAEAYDLAMNSLKQIAYLYNGKDM